MSALPMIGGGGCSGLQFVEYRHMTKNNRTQTFTIDANSKYLLSTTDRQSTPYSSTSHEMLIENGIVTDLHVGTSSISASVSGNTLTVSTSVSNTWGTDVRLYEFV